MTCIYLYEQKEKTDYYYEFGGFVIVKVSCERNSSEFKKYGYKCYRHQVSRALKTIYYHVGDVKLYNHSSESGKNVEIKLNNGTGGKCSLKYCRKWETNIYVFFYGEDPRPLLLCYNGWAYAAKTKDGYFKEWYKDEEAGECDCSEPPSDQNKLLEALVQVSDFLNPVNLNPVLTRCSTAIYYVVHTFNGQKIQIKFMVKYGGEKFCYDKYTHTHGGIENGSGGEGFRLGNIHHCENKSEKTSQNTCDGNWEKNCIKENGTSGVGANGKCISASDVDDPKKLHRASPEVVVYYYKKDNKHEHPLLVALRKPEWCTYYSPYFELQKKVDPGHQKVYTKKDDGLDLGDTSPDGDLAKKLDDILYRISKQLQVILAERPVATKYSATKGYPKELDELKGFRETKEKQLAEVAKKAFDEAQEAKAKGTTTGMLTDPQAIYSSLTHHVLRETSYEGQLFEAGGTKPASPPPSQTTITVREVDCPELYNTGGYRCFKHLLTTATGIDQVGGLRLAVFSGQGGQAGQGEITLCTGKDAAGKNGQNCQNGKNGKKIDVTYTTCKGDLYVFFYGDDPRPLMLCYDNNAYRPMTMAGYCTKWVRVNEGSGAGTPVKCLCQDSPGGGSPKPPSGTRFNAQKLLPALYQVSVFMNPVRLCLGPDAIKAMEHKKDQDPPTKPGEHLYVAHKYPPKHIQVKVTPRDLNCYRRYTHKPAKQGFRLGAVTYESAEGGAGASVSPGQPATCTASQAGTPGGTCPAPGPPAPTPITTPKPFCFPYPPEKQLWSVCVYYYMYDKCHNWPLVVELGFRGQSSEFYRLCCKGSDTAPGSNGLSGQNGDCKAVNGLKWVRMAGEGEKGGGDSCKNGPKPAASGNGNTHSTGDRGDPCQPCNTGTDSTNGDGTSDEKAETCRLDREFVERARKIHHAIYSAESPSSVFLGDRVPLESDLNDLIEGRAYEIRTQLGIQYTKDEKCLILATSSRCWEDSIMGYVVCR